MKELEELMNRVREATAAGNHAEALRLFFEVEDLAEQLRAGLASGLQEGFRSEVATAEATAAARTRRAA